MGQSQALIIDDNAKNVNVLSRLLASEGLSSIQVMNPAQIEAALGQTDDIQVVFLDLEMPQVDGFTVFNQLKADARFRSVPVIAYAVHVSEIHVVHEYGFDGFLGKPLDSDKFPDQLARILRGEAVWEVP